MKTGCVLMWLAWSLVSFAAPTKECVGWFNNANLESKDKDCLEKCGAIGTNMNTFMCPQACAELCSENSGVETILGRLMYYPGLTAAERKLVTRFPKETIVVFRQKVKAESATEKTFRRDEQEDESDAFRHFLWAGLLFKELGPDLAKQCLDAHESSGQSDNPGRAMDLANNRAGLLTAARLKEKGTLNQEELEKAAVQGIRTKELIVLKPRGFK